MGGSQKEREQGRDQLPSLPCLWTGLVGLREDLRVAKGLPQESPGCGVALLPELLQAFVRLGVLMGSYRLSGGMSKG